MRDGFRRGKSSGSVGIDGEGEEEEDGLSDGLEGLMSNGSDGGGKKQVGMNRFDGEVDQDSDWSRSKGMSMMSRRGGDGGGGKGRVQDISDDGDEEEDCLEKDNLKWPAGEGWKPL